MPASAATRPRMDKSPDVKASRRFLGPKHRKPISSRPLRNGTMTPQPRGPRWLAIASSLPCPSNSSRRTASSTWDKRRTSQLSCSRFSPRFQWGTNPVPHAQGPRCSFPKIQTDLIDTERITDPLAQENQKALPIEYSNYLPEASASRAAWEAYFVRNSDRPNKRSAATWTRGKRMPMPTNKTTTAAEKS